MGEYLIAGSTNWTTSSKCNAEVSVLIKLGADGLARFDEQNRFVTERATPLTHTQRVQMLLGEEIEEPIVAVVGRCDSAVSARALG